jgi:hypothetical protein
MGTPKALVAKDTERKRVEELSPNSRQRETSAKAEAKVAEKQAAAAAVKVAREEQEAKDVQAARDFVANLA